MKEYKGYYIDGFTFTSEADIDEFLKDLAIQKYRSALKLWKYKPTLANSINASSKAEELNRVHGVDWSIIQEIEKSVLSDKGAQGKMIFLAYWKDKDRNTYHGFVKADNRYEAKKILDNGFPEGRGFYVTAIYKADESQITPQSLTYNFPNTSEYKLFE